MAERPKRMLKYLRFSTIGLELGISVLLGLFVGQWLDKQLGTTPWLLLLCLLVGLAAGFRSILRLLKTLQRDEGDNGDGSPDERP